jgi:FkbM family methyltransferase
MKNYSQNKEQDAILNYFGDFKGTFLSIGENDGETLSNVRALALSGWCGVMVEPSPIAFNKLKKLYEENKKGCFYLHECAIGDHNGKATLYDSGSLFKTGDTSLVSTLVEEQTERFKSVLSYSPIEVKVYKWKTFFNRLYIKKFDFVSLDAEGMDDKILDQMDISEVKCLCIEFNGHQDLKAKFDAKMQGFKIIYTSAENIIYAR